MFLNSINHFRAIAIVLIVAGHAFYPVDASFNTLPEQVFGNLIAGGTALFVFISGFLFHHIFYKRYKFNKFITGKLKKVLLPYTILSIVPILMLVLRKDSYYDVYDPQGVGFVNTYLIPAFKYYITGGFLTAYWYIPFAMVLFLMSPLHVAFIKAKFNRQCVITFVLFSASLFLHRPVDDILILQAVVYFMPFYLLGIMCSQKKDTIYSKFKNKEVLFLLAALVLATLQASSGEVGNYHKPPMLYQGIDLMVPQKIALCLFFVIWLHRFEKLNSKYINVLASTSFAIYFMHAYLLLFIREAMDIAGIVSVESPWLWYPVVTVGMIFVSLALALGIKKLLPNYSRYLIGY